MNKTELEKFSESEEFKKFLEEKGFKIDKKENDIILIGDDDIKITITEVDENDVFSTIGYSSEEKRREVIEKIKPIPIKKYEVDLKERIKEVFKDYKKTND